ncbi:MAG TPA: formylglycine-generating enzyme family protein, partial [Isosphaeraceae bacterium]|nr:formylglycine-generating enzyme family protein [Isosphaeraceae bacterium]
MRLLPHSRRLARLVALGAGLTVLPVGRAQDGATATPPSEMRPYVETIPGTELKFEMVPIPGGTFTMGSPPGEPKRSEDEGSAHEVAIAPLWMGKHEVTWDEYDEFAFSMDLKRKGRAGVDRATQPETEKAGDAVTRPTPPYADETFGMGRKGQPVICITHHAAMEYCRWLSAKTGKTYRLPTEAEWEYACRSGSKAAYSFGGDPSKLDAYAWYVENAEKPQPVGKKKPNAWGLCDMHGNVSEWCLDHY